MAVFRQRKYQIKHREQGLCKKCTEPAVSSGLCLAHYQWLLEYSRAMYYRRKEKERDVTTKP